MLCRASAKPLTFPAPNADELMFWFFERYLTRKSCQYSAVTVCPLTTGWFAFGRMSHLATGYEPRLSIEYSLNALPISFRAAPHFTTFAALRAELRTGSRTPIRTA